MLSAAALESSWSVATASLKLVKYQTSVGVLTCSLRVASLIMEVSSIGHCWRSELQQGHRAVVMQVGIAGETSCGVGSKKCYSELHMRQLIHHWQCCHTCRRDSRLIGSFLG